MQANFIKVFKYRTVCGSQSSYLYFLSPNPEIKVPDYYLMDEADGKITVVNGSFYDGDEFKGVVEYIFESSLS